MKIGDKTLDWKVSSVEQTTDDYDLELELNVSEIKNYSQDYTELSNCSNCQTCSDDPISNCCTVCCTACSSC